MEKDLTKGSLFKTLISVSLPTSIGFTFQMFYDFVDIFWIGKISDLAIAGVTIFSTIFWVTEALNEIIGVSSVSLISQSFGKNDIQSTNKAIEQTIALKFVVATISAIILGIIIKPVMGLFADETVVKYGLSYGYFRIIMLPIMFSSFSVNTALRSVGDAKTPMKILVLSTLINLILDPIFIFNKIPYINLKGLGFGVFGASLATGISQFIASLIGFYVLFYKTKVIKPHVKNLFKLEKNISKKLFTIGLPNGFEVFLRNFFYVINLRFVSFYGEFAIAALGIGSRIISFVFMPLFGFFLGASSIVGQSLGAEKIKRAENTAYLTAGISGITMTIFFIFTLIFGKDIVGVFTKNHHIIKFGVELLRYGTIGLIFVNIGLGLSSVFSGSGYNVPFFYSSLISRWVVQLPLMYFVVVFMKLKIIWLWLTFLSGDIIEFLIFLLFFINGKWKVKRVKVYD